MGAIYRNSAIAEWSTEKHYDKSKDLFRKCKNLNNSKFKENKPDQTIGIVVVFI